MVCNGLLFLQMEVLVRVFRVTLLKMEVKWKQMELKKAICFKRSLELF
jgi:hypothetical protein